MFVSNAYIKDLNTWRILMNFLCIYLGEGRGGGAGEDCTIIYISMYGNT